MPSALVLGGGTGLLGQALMKVLSARGWKTASFGRADGDLLDPAVINNVLDKTAPDAVFNTVAWTQVDDAEEHEDQAMLINRTMPANWARALKKRERGQLLHFSTDFVFSGSAGHPRRETDLPAPESVYGRTKLEGEKAVLEILPERSAILRTAWLFGQGRKNFVKTILGAAADRDTLGVVDDQTGSPTYTTDLATWSAILGENNATGIWHCVNSGQASWCELAIEALRLASSPCRVQPVKSSAWPQKAKRPANSVLDNSKLANFLGSMPRPWPLALRDYIYCDLFIQGKKQ